MDMNMNMNSVTCQFQNHLQLKINSICFNKNCKSMRLCCAKCAGEFHRDHLENIIGIDQFNSFIQQEGSKQVQNPGSYTYGQGQLIQNLEELLNLVDGFYKTIKQEIDQLKKASLQEYLKQYANAQQGIQIWNQQIEFMLQYFEVEDYVLIKKDQKQGQLNEAEKKSNIRINQAKDSLIQIQKLLEKESEKKQLKFQPNPLKLQGHSNWVNGVVISSDGTMIASGSTDKTVKLWNVKAKELMQTFQYSGFVYEGVAFSSNNLYLAYGGGGDYSIQLQDLKSKICYATLIGHNSYINAICFSEDSQLLYSGGAEKKLIVWNINQKAQIHSFDTDSEIRTIVNSPDNKLISCICYKYIYIWDYSTKTRLIHQKDPHQSEGCGLCSSKDSSMFISSGKDGLIKIWMVSDSENNQKFLKQTREIKAAAGKSISQVILTPDEQYIVSICNELTKIMIHEVESGNLIQELYYGNGLGMYCFGYISISKDMNFLVCGGGIDCIVNNQLLAYMGDTDSSIYLRNIFSQKQKEDVKQLKIDNNHGISLIFDQDSKFLIRCNSKMINVYNIHLNVLVYTLTSQFFIIDIDLSTDNKLLSSISIQGQIQIWSFKSRRRVVQQMVQKNASGLKFSKKSEMILTVGAGIDHGAIKVWKIVGMRNQLMKIFQIKIEGTQNLIGCFFSDTFILTKYKNSREIKFKNISSRKIEETLEFSEGSEVNAKIITSSDNNLIVYSASWWLSMWKAQYA